MKRFAAALLIAVFAMVAGKPVGAQTLADYTAYPAFLNEAVPPIVMFVMGKDHKLFYKAYNDVMDLDGDGTIETTYDDSIDYYGYFGPNHCYTYTGTQFEPTALATGANNHFCTGAWSGNFLNWATMSRMDIIRKVLYGGYRLVDTNTTTVLGRALLPRDGHAWAKVYAGADLSSLIPFAWSSITLCNLNTNKTENSSLMYAVNGYYPYAAGTETLQCTLQGPGGPALIPDFTYNADVLVCDSSMLESNCEKYQAGASAANYKPAGIMQKFGIDRQGTTDPNDDVVQMQYGLITGSYGGNVSGGVVRSNIVDVNSEIDNTNGQFKSNSKLIKTLDRLKVTQYNYATGWYDLGGSEGSCVPGEPATLTNGLCTSWGNPIGEMLYETIRFFQGQSGPTNEFDQADPGFSSLPNEPSWTDPYTKCPYCAQPFALVISDAFPSYDSDHLPGSYWPTPISTSDTPSVQTLLSNANADINTLEGMGNVFIGQSGAVFDRSCTTKAGDFASVRGLCGEEPTKQGAYYAAGLAHYAKTTDLRPGLQGDQKMTTYAVVTGSPLPNLEFAVGANTVQIIPSFSDNSDNSKGQLVDFQFCQSGDPDWTAEQGNGYTSCYDVMWDDAEYGWDYDLDVRYRIYVKTGAGTITVKTKGVSAAASHNEFAGYLIQGVSGQGEYLDIWCGGGAGFSDCDRYDGNETAEHERTFTATGSSAGLLKDPLWYAAKYGGFDDSDASGTPNQQAEWDEDADGLPDTYFYAASPLKLEEQLGNALLSILDRAASGSAASVLASSSTGEGALYQAFFHPRLRENGNDVAWIGFTQGLFLDALGNLREDNGDAKLVYKDDKIIRTRFDVATNKVVVDRFADSDENGLPDSPSPVSTVDLRNVSGIWEAGDRLAQTASTARTIRTWVDADNDGAVDAGEELGFTTANASTLAPYLRADATAPYTATNIINFIRGDQITGMRDRQLTAGVWKLGDAVHAQPITVAAPGQRYDLIYGDVSYVDFFKQYKDRRQVVYVGANDGMLHAFNAGYFHRGDDPSSTSTTEHGWFTRTPTDNSSGPELGDELWGFIPQELLPHLKWLTQADYTHVYYVDLTPKATDVRIFCDAGGNVPSPCINGQTGAAHPNGWGTILMAGFRLGGSCGACTSGTGAPPMTVTADFDTSTPGDETRTFYSAYFVLDITDPEQDPKLLWSFSSPDMGLATTRPSMLRVNPAASTTTDHANAEWYMVVGSGPTGYNGSAAQSGKNYAINLLDGTVETLSGETLNAFMGTPISIDRDLDYRVDVTYSGSVINDGSLPWRGKLYRLTMNSCSAPCLANTWGIDSDSDGTRELTEILDTFSDGSGTVELGPIAASPAVAIDDANKLWVFAGTGRNFSTADKTDTATQYFVGVKDSVMNFGCTQSSQTNCHDDTLVDVSNAEVCIIGTGDCGAGTNQVTGVTGATDFPSLVNLVASKDGWFTTLPGSGERALSRPLVFGGVVLFPTFVPNNDPCTLNGETYVYALYYRTGGAYSKPVIGTEAKAGKDYVKRSTSAGMGISSEAVIHIGKGSKRGESTAYIQKSSGELYAIDVQVEGGITSRTLSWFHNRS